MWEDWNESLPGEHTSFHRALQLQGLAFYSEDLYHYSIHFWRFLLKGYALLLTALLATYVFAQEMVSVSNDVLETKETAPYVEHSGDYETGTMISSRSEIRDIGRDLGIVLTQKDTGAGTVIAGNPANKYRFARIYGTDKPGADVLYLSPEIGVDTIKCLRMIVSGYVQEAFSLPQTESDAVAEAICAWNTNHYNDTQYFSSRYNEAVIEIFSDRTESMGLSPDYTQWPNSRIVIPHQDKSQSTQPTVPVFVQEEPVDIPISQENTTEAETAREEVQEEPFHKDEPAPSPSDQQPAERLPSDEGAKPEPLQEDASVSPEIENSAEQEESSVMTEGDTEAPPKKEAAPAKEKEHQKESPKAEKRNTDTNAHKSWLWLLLLLLLLLISLLLILKKRRTHEKSESKQISAAFQFRKPVNVASLSQKKYSPVKTTQAAPYTLAAPQEHQAQTNLQTVTKPTTVQPKPFAAIEPQTVIEPKKTEEHKTTEVPPLPPKPAAFTETKKPAPSPTAATETKKTEPKTQFFAEPKKEKTKPLTVKTPPKQPVLLQPKKEISPTPKVQPNAPVQQKPLASVVQKKAEPSKPTIDEHLLIREGALPAYYMQRMKILLIGKQSNGIYPEKNEDYTKAMTKAYKAHAIASKNGYMTPSAHIVHRRMLKYTYGLQHNLLLYEIPKANKLADLVGKPDFSFARINFEEDEKDTRPLIKEISILRPDIVICMKLSEEVIQQLGTLSILDKAGSAKLYDVKTASGFSYKLINTGIHFSKPTGGDSVLYGELRALVKKAFNR